MSVLCITVRWLDDRYHGLRLDGTPEWPPSPLRLFQALVAAGGRHGQIIRDQDNAADSKLWPFSDSEVRALEWLADLCDAASPVIVAPRVLRATGYVRYVPNNDAEKKSLRTERLSDKPVRPTLLESRNISYVWQLPAEAENEGRRHRFTLESLAHRLVAFGWGVDMAVARVAFLDDTKLPSGEGEAWLPGMPDHHDGLRVPSSGTLRDVTRRHHEFMARSNAERVAPPSPLTKFRRVSYRRASDPPSPPIACFDLSRLDGRAFRSFDASRGGLRVAGLMRHATSEAAKLNGNWPDPAAFILGHGEPRGESHRSVGNARFAFLPLPSIQPRGKRGLSAGSVHRVCVTVFDQGHEDEVDWARRTMAGQELVERNSGEIVALLKPGSKNDGVVRFYCKPSAHWASVTPLVLPGYDDPAHYRRRLAKGVGAQEQIRLLTNLHLRIERLLRKAIRDAGFSDELARHAELDWRDVSFWPGAAKACDFRVPEHLLRYPKLHVLVKWRDAAGQPVEVPGPICLGGGRFVGLGLLAALTPPVNASQ